MALLHKGNRYVEVPEHSVSYYLDKGYSVEDEFGNVLQASLPTDKDTLQQMVKELRDENAKLKAENEALKDENEELKKCETKPAKATRQKKVVDEK